MRRFTWSQTANVALALAWAAWAGARLAAGGPIAALLALQAGLVAGLLLGRRESRGDVVPRWRGVAWASALLPLAMRPGLPGALSFGLQVAGLAFSLWALGSLGASFGIAPADRGLVERGPYGIVRHPAYLGELVGLAGVLLSAPSAWNAAVVLLVAAGLVLRARLEEATITGYPAYAARVRFRLLPGIW